VVVGVVLAGGQSRRMGRDKALVEVGGKPMIAWVVAGLEAAGMDVVVAGRPEGWEGRPGLRDPPGLAGPLAGLVAALALGSDVLAVGVDQPWLRSETVRQLLALSGTAVPLAGGVRQVTCARYSATLLEPARRTLSVQALLDQHPPTAILEEEWRRWGEDGRSWYSVDDERALHLGLERFGPPGGDRAPSWPVREG
jgi:molybdopterin-guanine dinucleotide biosynthesis protein A